MSEALPLIFVEIGAGPEADAEELATVVGWLRDELLQLDVDAVERATTISTQAGTKGSTAETAGTLIITISNSAVLVALVGLLRSWISRGRDRSVKLKVGRDVLEVTGTSAKDQERLIQSWLDDHARE